MADGLNMQPRIGEPESAMTPGMAAPREPNTTTPPPIAANSNTTPTPGPGPYANQQPASWVYDFNPVDGSSRATFNGEIDYLAGGSPGGVNSVNGRQGDVVISTADITAAGGATAAQLAAAQAAAVAKAGDTMTGNLTVAPAAGPATITASAAAGQFAEYLLQVIGQANPGLLALLTTGEMRLWNANNAPLTFGTTNTERLRLDPGGHLALNCTTDLWGVMEAAHPTTPANVWIMGPVGDGTLSMAVKTGNIGLYLAYATPAAGWQVISDERAKIIRRPIADALGKVRQLRAAIACYKTDKTRQEYPVLIAQDVQKVLPQAVDASDPDRLGLAYQSVIPLLVAAIKDLADQLDDLKTAGRSGLKG